MVVNDITADANMILQKSANLDLNGKTLSFSEGKYLILQNNVTIKNGEIMGAASAINAILVIAPDTRVNFLRLVVNGGLDCAVWVKSGNLSVANCRITTSGKYAISVDMGSVTITGVYLEATYGVLRGPATLDGNDLSSFEGVAAYVTPHTCLYNNDCDTKCNICQVVREVQGHVFDNSCDVDCNECGSTREPIHNFENFVWGYNKVGHWKKCGNCQAEEGGSTVLAHTFGEWTDSEKAYTWERTCACGYKEEVEKIPEEKNLFGCANSLESSLSITVTLAIVGIVILRKKSEKEN